MWYCSVSSSLLQSTDCLSLHQSRGHSCESEFVIRRRRDDTHRSVMPCAHTLRCSSDIAALTDKQYGMEPLL